jgi:hypothetical protein
VATPLQPFDYGRAGQGKEEKKKKNPGINRGQPAGKGRKKKKKKNNPGINPGQPVGKGGKKKVESDCPAQFRRGTVQLSGTVPSVH